MHSPYSRFYFCWVPAVASDWMWLCPCIYLHARWPEAHHQAETVGFAGRAGRKVRMAPRGSPEFLRLPPPDVGPHSREKTNGCRMPPSFLDRPLVAEKLQSVSTHSLTDAVLGAVPGVTASARRSAHTDPVLKSLLLFLRNWYHLIVPSF